MANKTASLFCRVSNELKEELDDKTGAQYKSEVIRKLIKMYLERDDLNVRDFLLQDFEIVLVEQEKVKTKKKRTKKVKEVLVEKESNESNPFL